MSWPAAGAGELTGALSEAGAVVGEAGAVVIPSFSLAQRTIRSRSISSNGCSVSTSCRTASKSSALGVVTFIRIVTVRHDGTTRNCPTTVARDHRHRVVGMQTFNAICRSECPVSLLHGYGVAGLQGSSA